MSYEQIMDDLSGVLFTTPTVFDEEGSSIDHQKIRENIRFICDAGAKALIPCGNTGEYHSLTNDERVAVVETTVDVAGNQATVLAGAGGSTNNVKQLAEAYKRAGADSVLVMYPRHTFKHEAGILNYYREIVEATDLGVVVYKRGEALRTDQIRELASYKNFVGIKYAVNDIKGFSAATAAIDENIVWINGLAERFAPAFSFEGADGFTTGIGNFVPEESLALMDALREGEWERAHTIRNRLQPYEDLREECGEHNTFSAANNVPAVKYGMELINMYGGPVRPPLRPLSEEDRSRASAQLDRIQNPQ